MGEIREKTLFQLKKLLDNLGITIYKLQEIPKDSNIVVVIEKSNRMMEAYNLTSLFDFISSNNPREFLKIYYKYNINSEQPLNLDETDEIELRAEIIKNLSQKAKGYFSDFKNDVIPLFVNVANLNYAPVRKKIIEQCGTKFLNTFKPKNNLNGDIEPNSNAIFTKIDFLMRNIINDDKAYKIWLHHLAWKIQFPLIQLPINWIIQDDGGTGKTEILVDLILDNLFNIEVISQDDLMGTFNFYQENNQFIVCEEIENFSNYKKMKVQTGAKKIVINKKNLPQYTIKNYNTYLILSNDIKPMKIDHNDRRFNIVGGGKRIIPLHNQTWSSDKVLFNSKQENEDFFKDFDKTIKTEIKELYSYLLSLKLDRNFIQQPIDNSHKQELININIGSEHDFIQQWNTLEIESFVAGLVNDKKMWIQHNIYYIKHSINNGYWIKSKKVYELYKIFCSDNGYLPIGQKTFFAKIHTFSEYDNIILENKFISYDNEKFQAIKLKKYKNWKEKEDIEPIKQINMVNEVVKEEKVTQIKPKEEIEKELISKTPPTNPIISEEKNQRRKELFEDESPNLDELFPDRIYKNKPKYVKPKEDKVITPIEDEPLEVETINVFENDYEDEKEDIKKMVQEEKSEPKPKQKKFDKKKENKEIKEMVDEVLEDLDIDEDIF